MIGGGIGELPPDVLKGTEEKDTGVLSAMTQPYQDALVKVQNLLDMRPKPRVQ